MPNQREMTITLTRSQVCDLMLATFAAKKMTNDEGKKWDALHELLTKQIEALDALEESK